MKKKKKKKKILPFMSLVAVNNKRQKRIGPHMENLLILQINGSSQQSIRAVSKVRRMDYFLKYFFKKNILKKYFFIFYKLILKSSY